ncbi:MAG TPA: calcium:proton antiporter [Bauldia sp.]|nr:calcium:proton antiporter [Bauldia sp.]
MTGDGVPERGARGDAARQGSVLTVIRSEAAFIAGAISALVLYTVGAGWLDGSDATVALVFLFAWIFGVMMWGAFAALHHADVVAERLGEPLGTVVLTISVIVIEVSVIVAVMLHGDADPTLARDTMLAVLIIVLNGMVGLALLVGGLRHREQSYNLQGARAYLGVLVTLATLLLILPTFTWTGDRNVSNAEALVFAVVTVALYATFLALQTTRMRGDFAEPPGAGGEGGGAVHAADPAPLAGHAGNGRSTGYHALFLLLTLAPIVLLAEKLAVIVDVGIEALHLPPALGGVLIAVLVLSPEGLAALKAASANNLQRAVNVCLGSALATISLTVPAVVVIAWLAGIDVILGLEPTEIVLLVLTLVLSLVTFGGQRTNMLQGAVHLVVFFAFLVVIFDT